MPTGLSRVGIFIGQNFISSIHHRASSATRRLRVRFKSFPSNASSPLPIASNTDSSDNYLCLTRGFVPKVAPVVSRKTSMLALVAAGYGIALVPEGMTTPDGEELIYRPLSDDDALTSMGLALPIEGSALAQRFVDLIVSSCGMTSGTSQ